MSDTLAQLVTGVLLLIVAAGGFALGYRSGRRRGLMDEPATPEQRQSEAQRPPAPADRIH